ncbi:MAG: adenylosuccinate synthetase, partial [Candidatus Omnitrophota bacterium]
KEFGATTGRPRRCGWFDSVIVKHAVMVNGIDEIVITKLDVLDCLDAIRICTAYKFEGKYYNDFPSDLTAITKCEPVYIDLPGWKTDTTAITSYSGLPKNAKNYLNKIKKLLDTKIALISVGSDRKQTFSSE